MQKYLALTSMDAGDPLPKLGRLVAKEAARQVNAYAEACREFEGNDYSHLEKRIEAHEVKRPSTGRDSLFKALYEYGAVSTCELKNFIRNKGGWAALMRTSPDAYPDWIRYIYNRIYLLTGIDKCPPNLKTPYSSSTNFALASEPASVRPTKKCDGPFNSSLPTEYAQRLQREEAVRHALRKPPAGSQMQETYSPNSKILAKGRQDALSEFLDSL